MAVLQLDSIEEVNFYTPILRDGNTERGVVGHFQGLQEFEENTNLEILPLIEVVDERDFNHLSAYQTVKQRVLVDVPRYLTESEEPNDYTESVESLLDSYGEPVEILNDNHDRIDIPIISPSRDDSYSSISTKRNQLSTEFDEAGIRLFVTGQRLDDESLAELKELKNGIQDNDIVLVDYIETGQLGLHENARDNIDIISDIFDNHVTIVLDVFSSYLDGANNYGPEIARNSSLNGFGDFAINQRYPPAGDIPMGAHNTRSIRYYDPVEHVTHKYQGDGFKGEDSAFEEMTSKANWDSSHCDFCREAENEQNEGFTFWKRMRMGHYIETVTENGS